jgi:hypothetical protein
VRFLLCSAVQFDGVFAVGDAGGGHGFTGGVFAQKTYLTMHTRIVTTIGIALALGAVESKAALQLTTANSAQHYLGSDNLGISGLLSNYGYVTGGLLYKHAPNDTPQETGTLAGSYNTVYVPNNEGTTTITHVGGDYANATYLVLKDGVYKDGYGGSWIWNLATLGWNGTDTINIDDVFGPQGHGISHVEFYGTLVPSSAVPEPSTYFAAALLALPVIAQVRRMRNSR